VTWLSTPEHVAVLGDYAPKVSGILSVLPIDEALDAIAFEPPRAEFSAAAPPAPAPAGDDRIAGRSGSKPLPLQPDYSVHAFSSETNFPVETIQGWLRRLRRKKQVIVQGPPGTGKTFVAERLARALVSNTAGFCDVVQFHPSYSYEDFVQGLRPRALSGTWVYELEPGRFLRFCEEAERRTDGSPCVLIIDEINRANLSRVFGELMYLLEYRDRRIPLAAGGRRFAIPTNVYIIGTMNTADRSIAMVDHGLRRRFSFIHLGPGYDVLQRYLLEHRLPADSLVRVLRAINTAIGDKHYELGISFFIQSGPALRGALKEIWQGEIEPYLEEYFYDQPERVEPFRWDALISSELADWRE
jgi:5-methylcytosine-specific restriction enzyme B